MQQPRTARQARRLQFKLKSRSTAPDTHVADMMEPQQASPPAMSKEKKDNPFELQMQLEFFKHHMNASTQRVERLKDQMERKSARKWEPAKKALMVRRLMTSTQVQEQCVVALEQLQIRLERALAEMPVMPTNNVAPFVAAPPTTSA